MRELIDRRELSRACYEIYEETVRKWEPMTAEEVKALMLRFEHAIKTAPTVTTVEDFKTCEHYPTRRAATGCAILTERICAAKGKCGFFSPKETEDNPPAITFAEILKRARVKAGLSGRQLAAAAGVSHQSVCRWECGGANPTPENRAKLAAALGMTVEELDNSY